MLGGAAAWPLSASAETSGATRRLAFFNPAVPADRIRRSDYLPAMLDELRRQGYFEGVNLKVELYGKEENASGLEALVARIVASKPDVVFVVGVGGPLFQHTTDTIPIVVISSDLVGQGLVQSLAHPGGNITGVAVDTGPAIWGKRIALLREMVPAMAKLAFLSLAISATALSRPVQLLAVQAAAEAAGVALVVVPVEYPATEADYRAAIETASREGADSIMVAQHPQTFQYAALLAQLTAAARLPAMYPFRENVEAGGLMAYAMDMEDLNRRAADAIGAILNGASPADIPVYQPSRFALTINLKTAHALGLAPPMSLLAAADEVIE